MTVTSVAVAGDCPCTARGWTTARLVALVWRLVADLAAARGLTVPQQAMHYCLPDRPYLERTPR